MINNDGPKVLFWDLETDGLQADRILCIGYKWAGEAKPHLLAYNDYPNRNPWWSDKSLLEDFSKVFNECDYCVHWYGIRFDHPVLQTRLIANGLPPTAPKTQIDLWKTARYEMKLYSNRLQAWQDHLQLEDDKTLVRASIWIKARYAGPTPDAASEAALKYIYDHCRADVLVLEEAFERMRPWVKGIPQFQLFADAEDGCPKCGGDDIQRRGYKVAATRTYAQYQCQDCKSWFRGKTALAIGQYGNG